MAPQQQQGQGDNSMSTMWVVVGCFLGAYFLWIGLHDYFVAFILKFKLFELTVIDWVVPSSYSAQYIAPAKQQIYLMAGNVKAVDFEHIIALANYVGDFIKIPVAMTLLALAYIAYNTDLTLSFKKTYSMVTLGEEEKKNWAQITPVLHLGLGKIHCEKGPWAMALTPMQFGKKYDLIEVLPDVPGKAPGQNIQVKKGKTSQIFSMQLGKLWTGLDGLSEEALALFAVFAARVNHEHGPAVKLIRQYNESSDKKQMDFSGSRKVAEQYLNTKAIQTIISRHAYEYTVLATTLSLARADGVLPSADFLWLKPRDRVLWFTLNGVGRQTPCAEVGGIYAHWFAELLLKRKLYVPMVDEASVALDVAVKEMIYKLDDDDE